MNKINKDKYILKASEEEENSIIDDDSSENLNNSGNNKIQQRLENISNTDYGYDENGIKIPNYFKHNKLENVLLYHGPKIPEELWMKPERPVGYFGHKGMDPSYRFVIVNNKRVIRAKKKKYLEVIYRKVRKRYKYYIKISRNTNELLYWKYKLDALPRNSSPSKQRNFCPISGRFRAYNRTFGLGRHFLRKFVNLGYIPGVKPANCIFCLEDDRHNLNNNYINTVSGSTNTNNKDTNSNNKDNRLDSNSSKDNNKNN